MSIAISLTNVGLSFPAPTGNGTVPILHEINMEVQQGETISITGSSGSGKTSLMMLIAGVEQASKGKLIIEGEDITNLNEDQLANFRKNNVGIVFQNFHLIPTMTALENVTIALEFTNSENSEEKAKEWLDRVNLSHRLDHYPEQLSGGEQQRVALARAFATTPKILLADEPTGNLDSENGEKIVELLFSLKEEYKSTLILITHDKKLASSTNKQLIMKDGRLYNE